jgi:hypothetical protein
VAQSLNKKKEDFRNLMRPVRGMKRIYNSKIPIYNGYYQCDNHRSGCNRFLMNIISVKITPQLVYLEIFLALMIWAITKSLVAVFQLPYFLPEFVFVLLLGCGVGINTVLWIYQNNRKEKRRMKKASFPAFGDSYVHTSRVVGLRGCDPIDYSHDDTQGIIEEEEEEEEEVIYDSDGNSLYPLDDKVGEKFNVQVRVLDMSKDAVCGGHHIVNPMKFGGVDFVRIEFIVEALDDDESDMNLIEILIGRQNGTLIGYNGRPNFYDEFGSNRIFPVQDTKYSTEYDSIPHYARGCVTFKVTKAKRAKHATSIITDFTLYRDEKTGDITC